MWGATRPIVMLKITADTISFDFPFSPNAESTFMPIANVEGSDIHYSRTGNGPPMTMLLPQNSGPVECHTLPGLSPPAIFRHSLRSARDREKRAGPLP